MDSVSFPSLQKQFLLHPPQYRTSQPFQVVGHKISYVKTQEQCDKPNHQIPLITNTNTSSTPTRTTFLNPKNHPKRNLPTPEKPHHVVTIIFNFLDDFICSYLDPPLRPAIDPNKVLSGNFAPVDELPPTACNVIEGSIPQFLNGTYIRNGPNPQFIPRGPYHLFDGDGMLHATKISNGKATFCSRFVKTYKYNLEHETGSPVFPNVFSAFNGVLASLGRCVVLLGRLITGQYDPSRGIGTANTSLAHFSGKLFALAESDLPYELKITSDGDIITLGRHEPFGEPFMTMTAHPKINFETGEAFAFRYSFKPPFLTYFRINKHGTKQPEVPIRSMKQGSFIHDFAITENYAVFPDTQIVIKPMDILKGRSPATVDHAKVPRLGVIPRYAADDCGMWWVEVPGLNTIHAVNAWEEDGGDTVVMVASNVSAVEHALERMDLIHAYMEKIEISVKDKRVTRRRVSAGNLDFPVINPAYVGRKSRYVYAGVGSPMPKIAGVVKLDLSLSTTDNYSGNECVVASRTYGPSCYGGEPFFVPREPDNRTAEEDDGYLISYVHNEITQESKFLIMDAKSPSLQIVASVKLPRRVPYGFHGLFIPESDLQKLR